MSRQHGKDCVCYIGSRDASGDITTITAMLSADVHDVTTQNNSGWRSFQPGICNWEAQFTAFYDGSVGGIERQLEGLLGAPGGIISIYDGDANAIGENGLILSDAVVTKWAEPITIADFVKLSVDVKAGVLSGATKAGMYGVLLHVLGAEAVSQNSASYDNGASSANGGRANLHVTAAAGTGGIVKIQHSANNSSWSDLVTFTTTAVAVAQTLEVAGTVNRYLRSVSTINSTSSLTFVSGFARY